MCIVACITASTVVLLLHTSNSYMNHVKRSMVNSQDTCKNFFSDQYTENCPVCSKSENGEESIVCEKSPISAMMAKCTVHGLVLEKFYFMSKPQPKLRLDMIKVRQVESERLKCRSPSLSELYASTEESDHVRQLMKKVVVKKPLPSSKCGLWLHGTTYIFGGDHHIYFRILGWYNLFRTIYYDKHPHSNYTIIRFTEDPYFADVERRLFPQLIPMSSLESYPVCMEKATLVPRSFTSTPFRCKMELLGFCSDCLLAEVHEATFFKYRNAMLNACSIPPSSSDSNENNNNIVVVLRKPYGRYEGDREKVFERVLSNDVELISALRSNFSSFSIKPVYMEELTLCEQINVSSSARVFMGVHGAGMGHLWWTPKGATILEIMPEYKSGKPSFEVLSKLLTADYHKIKVAGEQNIRVNVNEVVETLKKSIGV